MTTLLSKPTAADLFLLETCRKTKRFCARKAPSFILGTFEYKPGYFIIIDRAVTNDGSPGAIRYIYYLVKARKEVAGRIFLDRPCPIFVQECFVTLTGGRVFKAGIRELMRGILKANTLLPTTTDVTEVVRGINEIYGTVPAERSIEERVAEADSSQAPAYTTVPNLEQIDILQYTSNPQAFWAI